MNKEELYWNDPYPRGMIAFFEMKDKQLSEALKILYEGYIFMNKNPFPQDPLSGEITEFDPNKNQILLDEMTKNILEKVPMSERVSFLANSTDTRLEEAKKEVLSKFEEQFKNV